MQITTHTHARAHTDLRLTFFQEFLFQPLDLLLELLDHVAMVSLDGDQVLPVGVLERNKLLLVPVQPVGELLL